MTYKLTVKGLQEMHRSFNKSPQSVNKHAKIAMGKSVLFVLGEAKQTAPVGVSGRLRNSMVSKVEGFGSRITGRVGSSLTEIYPLAVEHGRKPGQMPPPSALERWVHIVLHVPTAQALSVAFVVARSIGKKGIRARPFLHNALQGSRGAINRFFNDALRAIVSDLRK